MEIFSLRANKPIDSILTLLEPPKGFRVNSISNVINATILFSNSNNNCTSLSKELRSPIADISETLDDDFLSCNSRLDS